jgi:dienelactone hydrolase
MKYSSPGKGTIEIIPASPDGAVKGLSYYYTKVIEPETAPKQIVVVYSDVFGIKSGNHRSFCDEMSVSLGGDYAVVLPDYFRGAPAHQPWSFLPVKMGEAFGMLGMLYRIKFNYHLKHFKATALDLFVPFLKEKYSYDSIACIGFW